MSVRREVRTPFTRFLERGHFYALGTDRFYVSVNMDVLVMYDSCYNRDSIFKRMTFNEETYILIRDFLEKIRNNDYDDIEDLGMECVIESTGVEIGRDHKPVEIKHRITYRHVPGLDKPDVEHDYNPTGHIYADIVEWVNDDK